ncbi:MAG: hypothetical protein ACXV2E_04740, partial [Halobacteriota archaeon]
CDGGERDRSASLELKTNVFQLPPVVSAASTAPPELVELFVEVRHPLALTATSTATRMIAINVCFSLTCFSRPDDYK